MMKDKILLFIPAYNCEKQIIRVLGQLDWAVMSYIDEVIVVNNRSTDNTEAVVLDFRERHPDIPLTLLRNRENYGLGGSHKVAFKYALDRGYDYLVVLHGDDQGSIEYFMPVFKRRYYENYDCILGARFMPGSKLKGYSAFRTFGNIVYDFLFAAVTRKRIYDLGSGLNMYSCRIFGHYCMGDTDHRYYEKFPDNLMFNYCMILAADYYRHSIKFFPISWREDDQVSNVKMLNQAVTVLGMLFAYFRDPEYITGDLREKKISSYEADVIG